MAVARRVYLYGIALIALQLLVNGLATLLQVGLATLVERATGPIATVGPSELRAVVSFNAALAAVGLVAWSIHWGLADRAVRRGDAADERGSAIRKLFLYAVLLIGGLDLTLAASRLITDLLQAALGQVTAAGVVAGAILGPLARVPVVGVAWLYYARVARADRRALPEVGAGATLRRWYVYGLSFVGLLLWLFAAAGLLGEVWEAVTLPPGAAVIGASGPAVAAAVQLGPLVAGLALWLLAWRWSTAWFDRPAGPDPEARSVLRKVYLYLTIAVAVAWTTWSAGRALYRVLRTLLLPEPAAGGWWGVVHDLGAPLATALVFGLAWLYHARVVEREAALAGERRRQATIRWFYQYLVALVGGVTFAVGLAGTAATVADWLVQPAAARPDTWWADRLSLFITFVAVGLPVWLAFWGRLQREAADELARRSLVRRIYLFLVAGLAMLALLGGGVFSLYQFMRLALGERWTAGQTSDLITAASAALVAGLLLAYHARVVQRDAPPAPAAVAPAEPVTAVAVIRAPRRELWQAWQREVAARGLAGVEVELVEVPDATAERLLSELRQAGAPAVDEA